MIKGFVVSRIGLGGGLAPLWWHMQKLICKPLLHIILMLWKIKRLLFDALLVSMAMGIIYRIQYIGEKEFEPTSYCSFNDEDNHAILSKHLFS